MLAGVYSYRVMVKSVSSCCVRGRWVLSNPVTYIVDVDILGTGVNNTYNISQGNNCTLNVSQGNNCTLDVFQCNSCQLSHTSNILVVITLL